MCIRDREWSEVHGFGAVNPSERARADRLKDLVRGAGCRLHRCADPEGAASVVLEELWAMIEADFPAEDAPSAAEWEDRLHRSFAAARRRGFVGREAVVRAIVEATIDCLRSNIKVFPEIMIPLVGTKKELVALRAQCEAVIAKVKETEDYKPRLDIKIGTMIEVPRAAVTANEIAEKADFFSFGTNDLTQMTFGFSRDDIGTFLPDYLGKEVLPADPFQTLDTEGVGQLIEMAVSKGRSVKNYLKVGNCGEHGGDPKSVWFCHNVGMDYVSCSPFRVPIARLAAAQAAIKEKKGK
jgi:hypothetical protein